MTLVLASASPRRAALLRAAGARIEVAPSNVDESSLKSETPVALARRVAQAKHDAAPRTAPLILAADTVVWIDESTPPLQKPSSRAEAESMLRRLVAARVHHVSTAFVLGPPGAAHAEVVTTRVWFRALAESEIRRHLDSDDWRDKAGGYGIQSGAASYVTRIEGSYTNVVGLPLAEVVVALIAWDERPNRSPQDEPVIA